METLPFSGPGKYGETLNIVSCCERGLDLKDRRLGSSNTLLSGAIAWPVNKFLDCTLPTWEPRRSFKFGHWILVHQRSLPTTNTGQKKRASPSLRCLLSRMPRSVARSPSVPLCGILPGNMAVGQTQWYHFGVGAPAILVYFSRDWDVHWGYDLGFDSWPYLQLLAPSAVSPRRLAAELGRLGAGLLLRRRLHGAAARARRRRIPSL